MLDFVFVYYSYEFYIKINELSTDALATQVNEKNIDEVIGYFQHYQNDDEKNNLFLAYKLKVNDNILDLLKEVQKYTSNYYEEYSDKHRKEIIDFIIDKNYKKLFYFFCSFNNITLFNEIAKSLNIVERLSLLVELISEIDKYVNKNNCIIDENCKDFIRNYYDLVEESIVSSSNTLLKDIKLVDIFNKASKNSEIELLKVLNDMCILISTINNKDSANVYPFFRNKLIEHGADEIFINRCKQYFKNNNI
jgi:hypothetical protein